MIHRNDKLHTHLPKRSLGKHSRAEVNNLQVLSVQQGFDAFFVLPINVPLSTTVQTNFNTLCYNQNVSFCMSHTVGGSHVMNTLTFNVLLSHSNQQSTKAHCSGDEPTKDARFEPARMLGWQRFKGKKEQVQSSPISTVLHIEQHTVSISVCACV